MIGVGFVSIPRAQADSGDIAGFASDAIDDATRITVPGAGPLYHPNIITELPSLGQSYLRGLPSGEGLSGGGESLSGPSTVSLLQGYDILNHAIGENWFPDSTAQVVDYPASIGILSGSLAAPDANDAIAMGQQELNDQIMNAVTNGNGTPVDIAALSEGTIVVDRELGYLATDPNAPPASDLQFAMFSNPELGLAGTYLPVGTTVPVIDYTAQDLPDTQYDVSVVFSQYDFFGDPPDRPWDLLAWVNSLFGFKYYHTPTALASPSDVVQLSSVTDSLGGTITTYMVPAPILPMLLPLEQMDVPQSIVDDLNSLLQPIVNDGYSSLTPDAGPYFSHGELLGLPTATEMVSSVESGLSLSAIESDIAGLDLPGLFGPDGFSVVGEDLANFSTLFGSDLVNLFGLIW
jgi:hypothetical protein